MKRRQFIKSLAAFGTTPYIPAGLTMASFSQLAKAAPIDYAAAGFANPAGNIMPQVINIFLYGGPSELAGNLTNIVDIEDNSQNSYRAQFNDNNFLNSVSDPDAGQVTANGFWQNAGGAEMEAMLAANDMSIYRTMLKQKSPTRSHRESIFMSHKGSIDIEGTPGVGTRLAAFLLQNKTAIDGLNLADGTAMSSFADGLNGAILPFVSFEGESNSFALDPENSIPLRMRGNTLNEDFDNPYARNRIFGSVLQGETNANTAFDALVNKVAIAAYNTRFRQAADGFSLREDMQTVINDLSSAADEGVNPLPAGTTYPNNGFGDRVKAAVTLALHNPSSFYITVGGGLGGWDDHNNGVDRYPDRMQNVMQTLQAAMSHINGFALNTVNGTPRTTTGNIVINLFGDFGRLVNLNGSNGWDHANNQNLYTFGGADLRPAGALGKLVGETHRVGTPNTNNQFTMPIGLDTRGESDGTTNSTYHFEPMAVAATTYSYFGAQDTKPLTDNPAAGDRTTDLPGDDPIDQTNAVPDLSV